MSDPAREKRRVHSASGVLVWGLALGQLIGWGTLYFAFALFMAPMEAGARLVAGRPQRGADRRPPHDRPRVDPLRLVDGPLRAASRHDGGRASRRGLAPPLVDGVD